MLLFKVSCTSVFRPPIEKGGAYSNRFFRLSVIPSIHHSTYPVEYGLDFSLHIPHICYTTTSPIGKFCRKQNFDLEMYVCIYIFLIFFKTKKSFISTKFYVNCVIIV